MSSTMTPFFSIFLIPGPYISLDLVKETCRNAVLKLHGSKACSKDLLFFSKIVKSTSNNINKGYNSCDVCLADVTFQ